MSPLFREVEENQAINFTLIFTCTENIGTSIDCVLEDIENNTKLWQDKYWSKFWCDQGEQFVLNEWRKKYVDYIYDDKEESNKEQTSDIESDEEVNTELWDNLWHRHREEIYVQLFYTFYKIFHQYCVDLKSSTEHLQEDSVLEEKFVLLEDFENLDLYGLPLCFGSKGRTVRIIMDDNQQDQECSIEFSSDLENEEQKKNDKVEHHQTEKHLLYETPADTLLKSNGKKKKKKRINRKLRNVPKFMLEDKGLLKYWRKRFSLFSRFDDGVRLDRESWFSVTPEKVAIHLAERLSCDLIIDAFCGCGGNAIQFAFSCQKVIAIDIDIEKIKMAKHNAEIYGVAHKIDFILGDYLVLAKSGLLNADIVFLSPPWGGPQYKNRKSYDIEKYLLPISATELLNETRHITQNIALFLPRNSNLQQIIKLAGPGNRCEIIHSYLDERLIAITGLYGNTIKETDVEI